VQATTSVLIEKALHRAQDSRGVSGTVVGSAEGGGVLTEGAELANVHALVAVLLGVLLHSLDASLLQTVWDRSIGVLVAPELSQVGEVCSFLVRSLEQGSGKAAVVVRSLKT
jgi:hypothetical protein